MKFVENVPRIKPLKEAKALYFSVGLWFRNVFQRSVSLTILSTDPQEAREVTKNLVLNGFPVYLLPLRMQTPALKLR
jgi:hypothetical protein